MKRLGDIVVGAGIEALDLVAPAVARREAWPRPGAARPPPGFEHRDAVHLGQPDVEDDGVVGLALAEEVALLAVEGAVDDIARVGERGRELPVEIGIVLDDEETQGKPSADRSRAAIPQQNRDRRALLCHYIRPGESLRKGSGKINRRPQAGRMPPTLRAAGCESSTFEFPGGARQADAIE